MPRPIITEGSGVFRFNFETANGVIKGHISVRRVGGPPDTRVKAERKEAFKQKLRALSREFAAAVEKM